MTSALRKAVKFPERVRRRAKATLVRPFVSPPTDTISVTDQDWDTLIILDACRYDTFRDCSPFDVPAKSVHSNASHTTGFLDNNFSNRHLDTVYVSASPQLAGYEDNFAQVKHVWEEYWDDDHRTVLPDDVTDVALEAHQANPEKKLVVHYMQPHYPFIGKTGRSLEPHATYTGGMNPRQHASIWEQLSAGDIDVDTVKTAYRENLELALPEVKRLVDAIDGKTVVTSDHANLFGKQVSRLPITIFGHPPRLPEQELVRVPWVEFPFDERRDVFAAESAVTDSIEKTPKERLEDLGYV